MSNLDRARAMRMKFLERVPVMIATAAAFGALVLAGAADAAEPAKPAPSIKGKGPLLSRDELRDCIARQDKIRTLTDTAQQTRAALDAEKADIARQEAAFDTELAALDRTNAEAVAAYNAKAQAHAKRVDDYTAKIGAFNGGVGSLQTERDAYAKSCDNHRYDEKDESAIKNGK